jgi:hypothetical protein
MIIRGSGLQLQQRDMDMVIKSIAKEVGNRGSNYMTNRASYQSSYPQYDGQDQGQTPAYPQYQQQPRFAAQVVQDKAGHYRYAPGVKIGGEAVGGHYAAYLGSMEAIKKVKEEKKKADTDKAWRIGGTAAAIGAAAIGTAAILKRKDILAYWESKGKDVVTNALKKAAGEAETTTQQVKGSTKTVSTNPVTGERKITVTAPEERIQQIDPTSESKVVKGKTILDGHEKEFEVRKVKVDSLNPQENISDAGKRSIDEVNEATAKKPVAPADEMADGSKIEVFPAEGKTHTGADKRIVVETLPEADAAAMGQKEQTLPRAYDKASGKAIAQQHAAQQQGMDRAQEQEFIQQAGDDMFKETLAVEKLRGSVQGFINEGRLTQVEYTHLNNVKKMIEDAVASNKLIMNKSFMKVGNKTDAVDMINKHILKHSARFSSEKDIKDFVDLVIDDLAPAVRTKGRNVPGPINLGKIEGIIDARMDELANDQTIKILADSMTDGTTDLKGMIDLTVGERPLVHRFMTDYLKLGAKIAKEEKYALYSSEDKHFETFRLMLEEHKTLMDKFRPEQQAKMTAWLKDLLKDRTRDAATTAKYLYKGEMSFDQWLIKETFDMNEGFNALKLKGVSQPELETYLADYYDHLVKNLYRHNYRFVKAKSADAVSLDKVSAEFDKFKFDVFVGKGKKQVLFDSKKADANIKRRFDIGEGEDYYKIRAGSDKHNSAIDAYIESHLTKRQKDLLHQFRQYRAAQELNLEGNDIADLAIARRIEATILKNARRKKMSAESFLKDRDSLNEVYKNELLERKVEQLQQSAPKETTITSTIPKSATEVKRLDQDDLLPQGTVVRDIPEKEWNEIKKTPMFKLFGVIEGPDLPAHFHSSASPAQKARYALFNPEHPNAELLLKKYNKHLTEKDHDIVVRYTNKMEGEEGTTFIAKNTGSQSIPKEAQVNIGSSAEEMSQIDAARASKIEPIASGSPVEIEDVVIDKIKKEARKSFDIDMRGLHGTSSVIDKHQEEEIEMFVSKFGHKAEAKIAEVRDVAMERINRAQNTDDAKKLGAYWEQSVGKFRLTGDCDSWHASDIVIDIEHGRYPAGDRAGLLRQIIERFDYNNRLVAKAKDVLQKLNEKGGNKLSEEYTVSEYLMPVTYHFDSQQAGNVARNINEGIEDKRKVRRKIMAPLPPSMIDPRVGAVSSQVGEISDRRYMEVNDALMEMGYGIYR